jgi:hypothetical protein
LETKRDLQKKNKIIAAQTMKTKKIKNVARERERERERERKEKLPTNRTSI